MSEVPNYVTVAELLRDYGLTIQDVRRHCPLAVEYTALDGTPCWLRADLAALLDREGGAE